MNKIKIIQNPSSGKVGYEDEFNEMCRMLLEASYVLHLYKTGKKDDAYHETLGAVKEGYDLIVVSGGDGTVNEVARALFDAKTKVPMAIFKTGTVNDFATHLKLPHNAESFVEMVRKFNSIPVDVGLANGKVFINIAAAGIFTSVAHETKKEVKKFLGRSAYYLEAMVKLPMSLTKSYRFRITSDEFNKVDDYHLFLITNSSSVAGFDRIAPVAEIQDGYFDCMFIKKAPMIGQADVFLNILLGKHLDNKYVDYFRTQNVKVELLSEDELEIDIDGEFGGTLPLDIEVVPSAIYVLADD